MLLIARYASAIGRRGGCASPASPRASACICSCLTGLAAIAAAAPALLEIVGWLGASGSPGSASPPFAHRRIQPGRRPRRCARRAAVHGRIVESAQREGAADDAGAVHGTADPRRLATRLLGRATHARSGRGVDLAPRAFAVVTFVERNARTDRIFSALLLGIATLVRSSEAPDSRLRAGSAQRESPREHAHPPSLRAARRGIRACGSRGRQSPARITTNMAASRSNSGPKKHPGRSRTSSSTLNDFYDGIVFHRVSDFMIQAGGYDEMEYRELTGRNESVVCTTPQHHRNGTSAQSRRRFPVVREREGQPPPRRRRPAPRLYGVRFRHPRHGHRPHLPRPNHGPSGHARCARRPCRDRASSCSTPRLTPHPSAAIIAARTGGRCRPARVVRVRAAHHAHLSLADAS